MGYLDQAGASKGNLELLRSLQVITKMIVSVSESHFDLQISQPPNITQNLHLYQISNLSHLLIPHSTQSLEILYFGHHEAVVICLAVGYF